jgi:two-component system NarL family response regulator
MIESRKRVLIVDDHPVVLEGTATLINRSPNMTVVAQAKTGAEGIALFIEHRPDLVLLDVRLPDISGVEVIAHIKEIDPSARIVVLTAFDNEEAVYLAFKAGAMGYLLKATPPEEMIDALWSAYSGQKQINLQIATRLTERISHPQLTPRQLEILTLVAEGKTNQEIAQALHITPGTVKAHLNRIFEKLQVNDRKQAIRTALERGLVNLHL